MSALSNDSWGRSVALSVDADGNDLYTVTDSLGIVSEFAFPTGTALIDVYRTIQANSPSVASLLPEKQRTLIEMQAQLQTYVEQYYDMRTQLRFCILYQAAVSAGLTNRAAYIGQLNTWVNALATYAASFTTSVMTQSDPETVAAMQPDFTQAGVVPSVTMLGAIAINS